MSTALYGGLIEIGADSQPIVPDIILAYRSGRKQGVIHNVSSFVVANHLMSANEITFDVHKYVNGEECELWSRIKDFKLVYIPHFETENNNPWYELTVTVDEADETVKHCEGVHIQEAELSQLTLNNVEINTENDIAQDDYVVTVLYNPDNPKGSLLHRILSDKASHYEIYHVDSSLAKMQRTFSWDGSTIKDAFDDIASELECLFVYGEYSSANGKLHRTISVYDLDDVCLDCGARGSFSDKVCTKCGSSNIKYGYGSDSGVFLSHENFASSISYSSNKDSVKNCFRLVAGDDLMTATVRNINPNGTQYIWYLSDEVRAEMSDELQKKLASYDKIYDAYKGETSINISSSAITAYNNLVDKYGYYDDTLTRVSDPIVGYSALTDFYYQALNLHSIIKTTLAPETAIGTTTTASEQAAKLTSSTLSPLGIQNATVASATTVTLAVANYAKVYIDTSLYKVTANMSSYSSMTWRGTITLTSYTDDDDKATTAALVITVTDATAEFLKCQLEKAMKKNGADATGIVALFKMSDAAFKAELSKYSVDNLSSLATISRACMDILIEQGVADGTVSGYAELYNSLYVPYYNKNKWIETALRAREKELLTLRGTEDDPSGVLDLIEEQRQAIADKLDLRAYLGDTLWGEFCSFRRDDEYRNENFISDGLTDEELIEYAREFYAVAEREISKAATLQHTISCNLNDFLLINGAKNSSTSADIIINHGAYTYAPNSIFYPIAVNFDIGNWLHIEIDGKVYKLRLTDYQISYDSLETLDVEFSDVTYGLGYLSDAQSILSKANSMATSYSSTVRQANKGGSANRLILDMVENGLYLTNKKIVNDADNQDMVFDETGLLMRAKNEFGDDYSDEQVKIINHGFYYTNDNWKTVQTGLGRFAYYDPETGTYKEDYGLIAHKIVGNIILGNELGIYNESGSVKMDEGGVTITVDPDDDNKDAFKLRKKNSDGSYTNYIYVDDNGNIKIAGDSITMSTGSTLESYIEDAVATDAASLVLQLSNEFIGITTDSNGDGGSFTGCYTEVFVFSGSKDVTDSADLEWTVSATSGITGEWDKSKHRYTVSNLSEDEGDVTFTIIYDRSLTVSKSLHLKKIKAGANGAQGAPGKDGVNGVSSYVHIKYSPVASPTDSQMTETPSDYIGLCINSTLADPTTASSYTWSRFTGEDGDDGAPGTNGKDGTSAYVHFAYATSADGKQGFSTSEFDGAIYIGIYTDSQKADSTTYTDYAWSKIKGDDGKDGTSSVVVSTLIEYCVGNNGTTPPDDSAWGANIPETEDGQYLWTRVIVTYSDGTVSVAYSVAKHGEPGSDGVGITSITPQYYLSSSKIELIDGTWGAAQPEWVSEHYIWTRSYIVWDNGKTSTTDAVLAEALNSANETASNASEDAANATTLATTVNSKIESVQTSTEALTTAIKEYVKTDDFETYKQYVTSQLSQTPEAITARFESIEQTITNLDDETKTALNEMATYIRADSNGLTLGKENDPIILNLNNGQISFSQNGQTLAYFSNNQLYVSHLVVTEIADLCGLKITVSGNYITIS